MRKFAKGWVSRLRLETTAGAPPKTAETDNSGSDRTRRIDYSRAEGPEVFGRRLSASKRMAHPDGARIRSMGDLMTRSGFAKKSQFERHSLCSETRE